MLALTNEAPGESSWAEILDMSEGRCIHHAIGLGISDIRIPGVVVPNAITVASGLSLRHSAVVSGPAEARWQSTCIRNGLFHLF